MNIYEIHGGVGDILCSYNPIKNVYNKNVKNVLLFNNKNIKDYNFIKNLFCDKIFNELIIINSCRDKKKIDELMKLYKYNIINFKPNKYDEYYKYLTLYNFHNKINFNIDKNASNKLYNELINKIGKKYILIHERPKDNCNRDMVPINRKYFKNHNFPVYNFDFFSEENYNIKSDIIFDYYHIIINASEIHVYNGSLLCFIDKIDHEFNNIYLHSYCKDIHRKVDYMNWIKKWNQDKLTFGSNIHVINDY
jgi:hypothetical protein